MATHSSVLALRIPGTGEPGGLLSMGSHRVVHDWSDLAAAAAGTCIFKILLGVLGSVVCCLSLILENSQPLSFLISLFPYSLISSEAPVTHILDNLCPYVCLRAFTSTTWFFYSFFFLCFSLDNLYRHITDSLLSSIQSFAEPSKVFLHLSYCVFYF